MAFSDKKYDRHFADKRHEAAARPEKEKLTNKQTNNKIK